MENNDDEVLSVEQLNNTIFNLLWHNKIFAKCPTCGKYLAYFEVYNCNCNICKKITFKDIIFMGQED